MTQEVIVFYAMTFFLLVGTCFTLVGAIGLVKFNEAMTRLHAPTKVSSMGIGSLLVASMIHSFAFADGSIHEILILAFLFVTTPISAHFMAKVNIHRKACETTPSPPRDETWSTLKIPEEDRGIEPDASGSTR